MPRYFFCLMGGTEEFTDDEGVDLPDLQTAINQAIDSARHIISEDLQRGNEVELRRRFDIFGAEGQLLCSVPFWSVAQFKN